MSAALIAAMAYWTIPQKTYVEHKTSEAIYKQFGGEQLYNDLKSWSKSNISEEVGAIVAVGAAVSSGKIKIKHKNTQFNINTKTKTGEINFTWKW